MGRTSKKLAANMQKKFFANLIGISISVACSNEAQFGGTANVSLTKKKLTKDAIAAISLPSGTSDIAIEAKSSADQSLLQAKTTQISDAFSNISPTENSNKTETIASIDTENDFVEVTKSEIKIETAAGTSSVEVKQPESNSETIGQISTVADNKSQSTSVESIAAVVEDQQSEEKIEIKAIVDKTQETKSEKKLEVLTQLASDEEKKSDLAAKKENLISSNEEKKSEKKVKDEARTASEDDDKSGSKDEDKTKLASRKDETSEDNNEIEGKVANQGRYNSVSQKDNDQDCREEKKSNSSQASSSSSFSESTKLSLIYDSSNCSKTTPYQYFLKIAEGRSLPAQLKTATFGYVDANGTVRQLTAEHFEIKYDSGACQSKNGSRVAVWVLELKSDARSLASEFFAEIK